MTRAQQQQLLLGGLAVVMIIVYARAFRRPARPASPAPPPAPAAQAGEIASSAPVAVTPQEVARRREAQRAEVQTLTWSRDPFTRSVVVGHRSGLQLSGILWDATSPVAIINGAMLQVGQEVDGYRVVEIRHNKVMLSDGTDIFQLTLSP